MTDAPRAPLRRSHLIAYAAPGFVVALPTIPVYVQLPTLYGVELGLGLAATGLVLLLARLFDTITDPLIGILSDRFPLRGLRRKPWIALGAVLAGWGLVRLLDPPGGANETHLLIWSLVLYAGWTMIAVPYLTWGAELHPDYHERTRITAWREAAALLGMVGAGAVGAYVAETQGADAAPPAIAWTAVALGALAIPALLILVPEAGTDGPPRHRLRIGALRSLLANKPFLRLLGAWFLNGLANGVPAALFFLYLEHGLGVSADERPRFIVVYFVAAVVAIPAWLALSRRLGKHRSWCWAMVLAVVSFLFVLFLPVGAEGAFMAICVLTGAALGADLALPPAVQADVTDYDRWRFGAERRGVQFALWGMATKFALAASVGLALPGVEWLGFDPANPTADGRMTLTVIYAGLPAVIKVAAIAVVWSFPLNAARQKAIRRRLIRRAAYESPGDYK